MPSKKHVRKKKQKGPSPPTPQQLEPRGATPREEQQVRFDAYKNYQASVILEDDANADEYSPNEGELQHLALELDDARKVAKMDAKRLRRLAPQSSEALMSRIVSPSTLALLVCTAYRYYVKHVDFSVTLVMHVGNELTERLLGSDDSTLSTKPLFQRIFQTIRHGIMESVHNRMVQMRCAVEDLALPAESNPFFKVCLQAQFQKHSNHLVQLLRRGNKKRNTPMLHLLSIKETNELVLDIRKNFLSHLSTEKFHQLCDVVQMAGIGVTGRLDLFHRTCWECGLGCEVTERMDVSVCSGCEVAMYCGRECQEKAWKGGHKTNCKTLPEHFAKFQESLEALDAYHDGHEYLGFNKRTAYTVFLEILPQMALLQAAFRDKGREIEGPSMKIFFQNIRRLHYDNWWLFQDVEPTMDEYMASLKQCESDEIQPATEQDLDNRWSSPDNDNFLGLAAYLCFDIFKRPAPGAAPIVEQNLNGPQLQQATRSMICVRLPSKGLPMPRDRFIALFNCVGVETNTEDDECWERFRRQKKRHARFNFRNIYHKRQLKLP